MGVIIIRPCLKDERGKMKLLYLLNSTCDKNCTGCYLNNQKSLKERDFRIASKEIINIKTQGHSLVLTGSNILTYKNIGKLLSMVDQKYVLADYENIVKKPALLSGLDSIQKILVTSEKSVNVHTYNDISKAITLIKSKTYTPVISYIIGSDNHGELNSMVDEALNLNVNQIRFIRYIPQSFNDTNGLSEKQTRAFIDGIKRIKEIIPKSVLSIKMEGQFGTYWRLEKGEVCHAGENYFAIGPDNLIYPCIFLMHKDLVLGKYSDNKVLITHRLVGLSNYDCKAKQIYQDKNEFRLENITGGDA